MERSSWNSLIQRMYVFFLQYVYSRPFTDLVGVLCSPRQQGHHTDVWLIGKTATCTKEGRVSSPPHAKAHVLYNAFPAFNYLPVLPCPFSALAAVFFVLQQRNLTLLGFKIPLNLGFFSAWFFLRWRFAGGRGIFSKPRCGSVWLCLHFKRDLCREAKLITGLKWGPEHISDLECKLLSVIIIVCATVLLGPRGHYLGAE